MENKGGTRFSAKSGHKVCRTYLGTTFDKIVVVEAKFHLIFFLINFSRSETGILKGEYRLALVLVLLGAITSTMESLGVNMSKKTAGTVHLRTRLITFSFTQG